MVDKYLYLVLFIAANMVGIESNDLNVSMERATWELNADGNVDADPVYKTLNLQLTRQKGSVWLVKDDEIGKNQLLNISESEITLSDKSDIQIDFDWVALKDFRFNVRDTIYYQESGNRLFGIHHIKNRKVIEIEVLDKHRVSSLNSIEIKY